MPFNLPGTLVPFHILFRPRIVIPALRVKDIRQLDFVALRRAGYRGTVFDKDNCLTRPHEDKVILLLQDKFQECKTVFGKDNVLIVSNSAGSRDDPVGIHAESVSHNLSTPVLRHRAFKPAYACINDIRGYFRSLPQPVEDHELVFVGDRLFTDVVLANRMWYELRQPGWFGWWSGERKRPYVVQKQEDGNGGVGAGTYPLAEEYGPLSVLTEEHWQRNTLPIKIERFFVERIERLLEWWDKRKESKTSSTTELKE